MKKRGNTALIVALIVAILIGFAYFALRNSSTDRDMILKTEDSKSDTRGSAPAATNATKPGTNGTKPVTTQTQTTTTTTVVTTSGSVYVPAGWKTYQNEKYGYAVSYPSSATIDTSMDVPAGSCIAITLNSYDRVIIGDVNASQYACAPTTGRGVDDVKLTTPAQLSLAGKNYDATVWTNVAKGYQGYENFNVNLGKPTVGFHVATWVVRGDNFAVNKNLEMQILGTFRWVSVLPEKWKTYTNAKYSLSFKYPDSVNSVTTNAAELELNIPIADPKFVVTLDVNRNPNLPVTPDLSIYAKANTATIGSPALYTTKLPDDYYIISTLNHSGKKLTIWAHTGKSDLDKKLAIMNSFVANIK